MPCTSGVAECRGECAARLRGGANRSARRCGIHSERDDILRRSVIMALMCQGELLFESIELGHFIEFERYFARELEALLDFEQEGLVRISQTGVEVTETGWYLVRAIAMVFDKNLQTDRDRARFSKII